MPAPLSKLQEKPVGDKVRGSIWSKLTEERGRDMKVRSVSDIGPGQYTSPEKV